LWTAIYGREIGFFRANEFHKLILAHTGTGAITLIDRVRPDLVALDYDLASGADSAAVAEHLRATKLRGSVLIHSENPFGQQVLKRILPSANLMAFGSFDIVQTPGVASELNAWLPW
jgi:DNA-binding NarL/FixJ family response regulator